MAVEGRDAENEDLEVRDGMRELGNVVDVGAWGIVGVLPRLVDRDELDRMRP